jgi:hypothetical protein
MGLDGDDGGYRSPGHSRIGLRDCRTFGTNPENPDYSRCRTDWARRPLPPANKVIGRKHLIIERELANDKSRTRIVTPKARQAGRL